MKSQPYRWTAKRLQAEVDSLDDTVELFWDYRDSLDQESATLIINEGEEGLSRVEDRLRERNWDTLLDMRTQEIKEKLIAMRRKHPVSAAAEARFMDMTTNSDKLMPDVNLERLMKNTELDFIVILNDPTLEATGFGITSMSVVRDLCEVFALLNINPAPFQVLVTADNDNRPSYDPEPVVFPAHPERDGHEYTDPRSMMEVLQETTYGGRLTFLFRSSLDYIAADIEAFKKGPIKVKKGTEFFPYDFFNGAGPGASCVLTKDLVLPEGSYVLEVDAARRYGVQSCYGFTSEVWSSGHITTVDEKPEKPKQESPYGKIRQTTSDIHLVDCWNFSNSQLYTIPTGTFLHVLHAYDATHTTCVAVKSATSDRPIALYPNCYRWIVENRALAMATGLPIPSETPDIIGRVMQTECH